MFVIEKLNMVGTQHTWESIESSWEFKNSCESLTYACKIAKVLAMRFGNDSQFRVVDDETGSVVANYSIMQHLISATLDGISSEIIDPDTEIPMLSEIARDEGP